MFLLKFVWLLCRVVKVWVGKVRMLFRCVLLLVLW